MVGRAVSRHATDRVFDAYTREYLGPCQVLSEQVGERDAEPTTRRVMAGPPELRAPVGGTVQINGVTYLVGSAMSDNHRGRLVRVSYVLQEAGGSAQVLSLDQVFKGEVGRSTFVSVRNTGEVTTRQDSKVLPRCRVTSAASEAPGMGDLIKFGQSWYYPKLEGKTDTGFAFCEADDVGPLAVAASTVVTRTFDNVTEVEHMTRLQAVTVLLPWVSEHQVGRGQDGRPQQGDMTLLTAFKLAPGTLVERPDGVWYSMGSEQPLGAVAHITRVRRHGAQVEEP